MMSATGQLAIFVVDALLVAWAAWAATCAAGLPRQGVVEAGLGWLLMALAWIAGSGVLLGLGGGLGVNGFLLMHAAGLALVLGWRGSTRADWTQFREWCQRCARGLADGSAAAWVGAALIVTLIVLAGLAARVEPIIYDALTYRLSRIGAWLQDGMIRHYATDDPRINYMPVAPDLVIAWLLGATREGYYLAPLSQLAGGILLGATTYGLARIVALSRLMALLAVGVLLGMANVAVQLTTVQSDLFTAGVFAASYYLWHRALERGQGSWVAGIGIALAWGSKGTMFYLAPGAAVWVGWLVWRQRADWRALVPTAGACGIAVVIFAVPGYWRNHVTYGGLFGPREAVVLHHGEFSSPGEPLAKAGRNLATSAVQVLEPNAQPLWLRDGARRAGRWLAEKFSNQPDPYVFMSMPRRAQLEMLMGLAEPDADIASTGLLAAALFASGLLVAALARKDPSAVQIGVWGAGVMLYLLTQHALVQWHTWAFRFVVLAAPWMAVVGVWAVARASGKIRLALCIVLVVSSVEVFGMVQWRAKQAAWQAHMNPSGTGSFFYYSRWRAWARRLDHAEEPLRLAFPINQPLAAFYRFDPPREVTLEHLAGRAEATAEAAVGAAPGWIVVPLDHFMGREGRVFGRTSLLNVAAYRALRPGEHPQALLYGNRLIPFGELTRRELVVRTWPDGPLRLEMLNPASTEVRGRIRTPTADCWETVPANGRAVVEVSVPPEVIALVTIDFPTAPGGDNQLIPEVRLLP